MANVHPAVAFATNIILDRLGLQPEKSSSPYPEVGDVPIVQAFARKKGGVALILGRREAGKTILAQRLAEITGRPTYAVSPEQKPPPWITQLKLEDLDRQPPPYSTLILDDVATYMSTRDYMSAYVQVVEKLIPVVRHGRKIMLIFVSQTAGQADKWILDSDLIFLKAPNPLYEDIERRAVARLYKRLEPVFSGMSDYQVHRYVYLHSIRTKGLATVNMPAASMQGNEVETCQSS